jgi:hypothetical protein
MRRLMHVMNVRPQVALATHSRSQICSPSAHRASSVPRSLPTWLAAEPVRSWSRQLSRPHGQGSFGDAQPGRVACVFIGDSSRASGENCRKDLCRGFGTGPGPTGVVGRVTFFKRRGGRRKAARSGGISWRPSSPDRLGRLQHDGGLRVHADEGLSVVDGRARLVDAQGLLA